MTMNTLKELYIDQLQDLYSANKQALEATQELVVRASHRDLIDALNRSAKGLERGIKIIGSVIKSHEADPDGEFCKGMEGLVKEIEAHVLDAEFGDDDVRDAMIITQAQRMTHYGLAGYGCVAAFAKRLGLQTEHDRLKAELDNIYSGDRELTSLAEGGINKSAAA